MRCICCILLCLVVSISTRAYPKFNSSMPLRQRELRSGMLTVEQVRSFSLKPLAPVPSFLTLMLTVPLTSILLTQHTSRRQSASNPLRHTSRETDSIGTTAMGLLPTRQTKQGWGIPDTGVGCAAADVNNDGYPEIYVTNYGSNRLYHNNGDGTFTDVTQKAGVGDSRWGTSCAFLDYDLDGDVDHLCCQLYEIFYCGKPMVGDTRHPNLL